VFLYGIGLVCYYCGCRPKYKESHRLLARAARVIGAGFLIAALGLTAVLLLLALSALP
jgi:hypothetical protein